MLPTKLWFIWPSGFRGEDIKKSANQKQELPHHLASVIRQCRPSVNFLHFNLLLWNHRQFLFLIGRFLKIISSETAWPNEPTLCRKQGPPIDDTYQVSVHLAKRFQRRRFFRNQPIRNKNCFWWTCLLTDQDEMISTQNMNWTKRSHRLAKWTKTW
jgi:hypothetical protein